MHKMVTLGLACTVALASTAHVAAHHSAAAFDTRKEVKITVLKTREFDARESAREEKMWQEAEQVLGRLTKAIKAGKYPSREKAEAALREAKEQLRKQEK